MLNNMMIIDRDRFEELHSSTIYLMDFLIIKEDYGTYTLYKNGYDGKKYTGLTKQQINDILANINEAYGSKESVI
jgi:hypothetical protein